MELFACADGYSCDRWNVVTTVILLNVLISLFSSAYEDVGLHFITTIHTQDSHKFLVDRSLMTRKRNILRFSPGRLLA